MSASKLFIFCLELSQKFAKNSSTVLKTSDVSTVDGRSPHVKWSAADSGKLTQ